MYRGLRVKIKGLFRLRAHERLRACIYRSMYVYIYIHRHRILIMQYHGMSGGFRALGLETVWV